MNKHNKNIKKPKLFYPTSAIAFLGNIFLSTAMVLTWPLDGFAAGAHKASMAARSAAEDLMLLYGLCGIIVIAMLLIMTSKKATAGVCAIWLLPLPVLLMSWVMFAGSFGLNNVGKGIILFGELAVFGVVWLMHQRSIKT